MHELSADEQIKDFDDENHALWFAEGPHTFTWKGIECSVTQINTKDNNSIVFTIYAAISSDAESTFLSIMDDVYNEYKQTQSEQDKCISVWNVNEETWYRSSVRSLRSFDTIYLPTNTKKTIIKYVDDFLASRKEYELFEMPYKLVGLLEGPPGTGKTSVIHALATKYEYNIAFLTMSQTITNSTLIKLISTLPDKCFLVIEECKENHNILDILDGINCREGMIVFIITNNRNDLGSALIRPGRVDFIATFDFVKEPEIREILMKFVPKRFLEFNAIMSALGKYNLTVATLQKFLFEHRHDSTLLKKSTLAEFEYLIQTSQTA